MAVNQKKILNITYNLTNLDMVEKYIYIKNKIKLVKFFIKTAHCQVSRLAVGVMQVLSTPFDRIYV